MRALSLLLSLLLTASVLASESGENLVSRALFTPGVDDYEPMGESDHFYTTADKVYFFTELQGLQGQVVRHRWYYGKKLVSEVKVTVRSPSWRAATKKSLPKLWVGEWHAEVVTAAGRVLASRSFRYEAPPY